MDSSDQDALAQMPEWRMRRIEATLRVVTPMFIGSADQKPTDGIRPPSIKGALRFWWRALYWGRIRRGAANDAEALKALHEKEAALFGIAASNDGGGQGCFLLRMKEQPAISDTEDAWPVRNTGAAYLSFGIMESGGGNAGTVQPHRQAIREGQDFKLQLLFKPHTSDADQAFIQEALITWGRLGGLGSRARRGHGSVTLIQLNGQDMRLKQQAYLDWIRQVVSTFADIAEPPYTAFSSAALLRSFTVENQARQAMEKAGTKYKEHRGQSSSLRGARKIGFGLPLENADIVNRRASPLLFHIQALTMPVGEGERYMAICLYLPATPFHYLINHVDMSPVRQFVQGGIA